ncbi:MAG: acyl-CoA dehydrogenase family protein [Burkholderiales bacterium]|nr:acyl-CoA dehydrogenase family protein [Burkholderiales bacterium]
MNFEYTEEQRQLADSLGKFLANHYDFEKRKAIVASASGMSDAVWAAFAEMGLTAIALPEADGAEGGFGGGAMDLMAAMEACGQALVVEPLLDNIGLGARLVARAGSAAQRAAWLPGFIDGSVKLAFAGLEPGRRYELDPQATRARGTREGYVLDGAKCVVIGAASATRLIVSARSDAGDGGDAGASLFVVDPKAPGVTLNPSRTVDGQRAADVRFDKVNLGAEALLGKAGGALPFIEEATDFATALLCAQAIGAMQYANDATLEYLKTRKQFGKPIGVNQVLQHRMVEMVIHAEQARSMAILAASKVDRAAQAGHTPEDARERMRAVSAAKVKIADAARHVSQEAVQLHGGMGMTEELKISHTFRLLTMIAQRFGDADHHLERYAALT